MNAQSFEEKIYPVKDKLYRFATRILNSHIEAEDIVQELLSKFWEKRKSLDKYDNLEAYAMQSVKNMCFDKIRHLKIVQASEKEMLETQTNYYQDKNQETNEMHNLIKQAINRLPEKQKLVMHLRDIEAYSFEEIEEVLKIDKVAIRVNLSRARKKVREEILKTMNHGI